MKFIIIRLDDPGDILFTTPVIRCLKKQVPLAQIHYLAGHESARLLQLNPYIDQLHIFYDDSVILEKLQEENYDLLIDLQDNRESRKIRKGLGIKTYVLSKSSWSAMIFKNLVAGEHMAVRFMQTVASICRYDGQGLDYILPPSEHISEKDIPASHQLGYIAFAIGGLSSDERISIRNIREFCQELDHPVILLGDKRGTFAGGEVSSTDPVKIYNACGKFSFNENGDLIKRSKIFISYDKGLIAIASALRKPVISIWTGNCPLADMQPYYPDADVMKTPPYSKMKKFSKDVLLENVRIILSKIQNSNSLTDG
ncbi:MAG: glycosyltransferase family 9 protein [Flavisolibacter sp.]